MSTGNVFFEMKNLFKSAVIFLVLINYSCASQNAVSAQQGQMSTQVFYDQLSPYGQWIDNPNYGYVWIPEVNQDFSPYSTSGYWVMTEYGWTWVSDYPWGWAPFHYGRWDLDNNYGWFWVPDNEWGPSWVNWRSGNGYYGWSPMRPGTTINMNFSNDYRDSDHWYFVRERDFGRHDMHRYYADRRDYNTIIINSTVINNTYVDRSRNTTYIAGPSRNDVQRVTGRKVSNVSVRDNDRPGQSMKNSQMQIYRPQIQKNSDRDHQPAPSRITNLEDVRPARERNVTNQRSKVSPTENNRREQQQSQPQRQRQVEEQRKSQPIQQTEKLNQEQHQQPQQQEQRRNQEQNQIERQNQQKQKQQINNQIQEQVKHQRQNTRHPYLQQKQQYRGRNQEQQNTPQQQIQPQNQTTNPSNTKSRDRQQKETESSEKKRSN